MPLPQGFVGSNPAPRTIVASRDGSIRRFFTALTIRQQLDSTDSTVTYIRPKVTLAKRSKLQIVSVKDMPDNLKALLLRELGLSADADGYITKDGKQVQDKYIEQPVRVENMAIFPGSTVVLDDNPLSIALYIEEYGED